MCPSSDLSGAKGGASDVNSLPDSQAGLNREIEASREQSTLYVQLARSRDRRGD